ncbi:4-hydroxy-tetrahydrodipicolinate reductase [hydrothermal vent metagenome]|uniref:4-hydroxy-tetrahydrodipicolinate reductase n=1 Tax=hydrothermal vent metagenome TaxID=652676 RepID=A0A3B0TW99_9ZZZZ
MADLKIVVTGAAGRMGAAIIKALVAEDALALHAGLERAGSNAIGKDAGIIAGLPPLGIMINDDIEQALDGADAIIDFSAPAASVALAKEAAKRSLVHVIGTTGCTLKDEQDLLAAAKAGAIIVKSGNMSLGVNLLAALVKQAASALGDDFDIEIIEMHHNKKVDAPSGTALMLGEAAAGGRKIDLEANAIKSRQGIVGARKQGTIGFATLRGGTVVGEHKVIFAGPSERLELTHKAQDRGLFATGAIRAVIWASDQKPGYYSMSDVLGLEN